MRKWVSLFIALWIASCTTQPAWALKEHRAHATKVASLYKLPDGLLNGICEVESSWQYPVRDGAHGEIGLCQLKPSTARGLCPTCEIRIENLHQGKRSKAVATLQTELKRRGYDPGTIDGVFGLRTHVAVTLFQASQGLKQDGIVGRRTWKALGIEQLTIEEQLRDPYRNIEYAARYLVWLRDKLGTNDPDILAAAYNGGHRSKAVEYMLKVRRANE